MASISCEGVFLLGNQFTGEKLWTLDALSNEGILRI